MRDTQKSAAFMYISDHLDMMSLDDFFPGEKYPHGTNPLKLRLVLNSTQVAFTEKK